MREFRFSKEGLRANALRTFLIFLSTMIIVLIFFFVSFLDSGEDISTFLIIAIITFILSTFASIIGLLIGNYILKDVKFIIDGPYLVWSSPLAPTTAIHAQEIKSISIKPSRIIIKSKSSWSKIRIPKYIGGYEEIASILVNMQRSHQNVQQF